MQTAETEYLEIRKQARGNQESANEQPENTEAVDVSEGAPVEEVIESEAQANEEVTTETEEPAEETPEVEATEKDQDLLYYDIDGEEVSSKQLSEWKSDGLKQADYTRKTQVHAEDVKAFNAEKEDFKGKQSKFDSHIATLEAMINEDVLSTEELKELREYEPEKYIEYTEKMANRKKFIDSNKPVPVNKSVDMTKVSADLFASHPEWMKDGKQSQQFKDDTNLMTSYAEDRGIGQDELSSFEARHFEVMLDAARYKSMNTKNAAIAKKVRTAPAITKPRAKATTSLQSEIEIVQKRFNKTGNDKDFLLLRKLDRQLNVR